MAKQNLSAELSIDASLGSRFKKTFSDIDNRINQTTRKMRNIGQGVNPFTNVDRVVNRITRQVNKFVANDWSAAVRKMTSRFGSGFRKVTSAVTDDLKKKFSDASRSASSKWKRDFAGIGANINRRGPPLPVPMTTGQKLKGGISDIGSGFAAAGLLALGAGFKIKEAFRNTNDQITDTHDNLRALKRQSKNYEDLAKHAREMDKSVSPWLRKIDKVNQRIDAQEKKLDKLRMARERYNRSQRAWAGVREQFAPITRRAGYAALGLGIGGGYAAYRGLQTYTDFDTTLNTLRAEGVDPTDIPAIRDQILRFAGETRFTALEIGNLLVSMKKDGQEITSELQGFGDLLKFAVAENKDINTAWDVTRTYINATNTSLENAVRLQEELSNATSLSKLQIEDYGFIAGKALSTFANLENFDTRGFNAIAGLLADTGVQAETVGITLRRFPLVLAEAAHSRLGGEKQGLFDALGINIANEQGQLKDIVTILSEFNRVFTERGFITDENKISTLGLTQLGGIFDTRYADAIGKMITGYEKIEKNIEGVGKVGTLNEKFDIHSQTLFAAQKRFQSAIESLGLRIFSVFDKDDNFIRIFDGMTAGLNRFVGFIEEHKESISAFAIGFVDFMQKTGAKAIELGTRVFNYFQERGPAIASFLKRFWADLEGVWDTLKPVVSFVIASFRTLFDTIGRLTGGNTKLLAWLAAAYIGWKTLKIPIMAVSAAYNGIIGTILKLKTHFGSLRDLISSATGKAKTFSDTIRKTPTPTMPSAAPMPTPTPTAPAPTPLPAPAPKAPPVKPAAPPVLSPALPMPTKRQALPKPITPQYEVLPAPTPKRLAPPKTPKALPAPVQKALPAPTPKMLPPPAQTIRSLPTPIEVLPAPTQKVPKPKALPKPAPPLRQMTKAPVQKIKTVLPVLPKLGILAKIGNAFLKIGNAVKWLLIPITALIGKLSFLTPVVTAVGTALAGIGSAIAAIGIGPVVAVVAAVVAAWTAAISIILKNWDKVKGAAIAVFGTIKSFGSLIWEIFKFTVYGIADMFSWLGNAIWNVIGPTATATGKVFKDVGTGIGNFFMTVFGSIWNFAKGVWNFVSSLFGKLFGWIESIAKTFTKWFDTWKSFFKKRNDEREMERITQVNIKETIEQAPIEDLITANQRLYENPMMTYIEDRPVQINQIDNFVPENILANAPYANAEFDVLIKEHIEKAPISELLQRNEEVFNRPNIPSPDDPVKVEFETIADTPDFNKLATDAMTNVESNFESTVKTPEVSQQVMQDYDTTSVEYIDFSSVDEIDKTLKAGFTSLEMINSQIITELKRMQGIDLKAPKIETPENKINIQTPGVEINTPPTDIKTPDVNVNTPPIPRPEFPALEKEKKKKEILDVLIEKPPPSEMTPPKIMTPELPILASPHIDQLDSPVIDSPSIPSIANPQLEHDPIEITASELPVQRIEVKPIQVDRSNQTEKKGDNIEITNNITITQQPGEDGKALADRVLREIKRNNRTGAYDS